MHLEWFIKANIQNEQNQSLFSINGIINWSETAETQQNLNLFDIKRKNTAISFAV